MLHQIGSGVLGPVFRTYDPQRDRLVAVKAFRLEIVPEEVARLAEALRRLAASDIHQPTLVAVLDAGLEGTTAYLAMEYVSAETLDVALRHLAPATLERALPVLSQIAEAMDEAWAAGLGHGALHPRDVFLSSGTDEVRVTGFGVVPALESVGVKTPARRPYAAPERVAGEPWDLRADVYSLGAIAHELLTRRRPAGPGEQDGTLVTGTSPHQRVEIRRVLSAALAERPQHRFVSARAFVAALGAIARGEAVGALPEGAEDDTAESEEDRKTTTEIESAATVVRVIAASPEVPADSVPAPASTDRPPDAPALSPTGADSPWPLPEAPLSSGTGSGTSDGPTPATTAGRWAPKVEPPAPVRAMRPPSPSFGEPSRSSMFNVPAVVAEAPPYPWIAIGAAAIASLVLGGVIGYAMGLRHTAAVATAAAAVVPVKPADTEVTVPEPPKPAVVSDQPAPAAKSASSPAGPKSDVPRAATTGRLVVRSVPAGAAVLVDGKPHGETPATVRDLPFGAHTVQVSHAGYASKSERVTLTAAEPARNLVVDLEATTGSIYVDSHPRGAQVLIDGHVVGTTPLSLPGISVGMHALRLQLAGHKPVSEQVRVVGGEQARVALTLEEGFRPVAKSPNR